MSVPLETIDSTASLEEILATYDNGEPLKWRLTSDWSITKLEETPLPYDSKTGAPRITRLETLRKFTPSHAIDCLTFQATGQAEYVLAYTKETTSDNKENRTVDAYEAVGSGFMWLEGRFGEMRGSVLLRVTGGKFGLRTASGTWEWVPGTGKGDLEAVKNVTGAYDSAGGVSTAWLDVVF